MRASGSGFSRYGLFTLLVIFPIGLAVTSASSTSAKGTSTEGKSLLAGTHVPAPVRSVLARACQDCHSENTVWPWYAGIPPLSSQIHDDVARGRTFMNLSKWNEYTEAERRGFRLAIGTATSSHIMPPRRYVWMHSNGRLSASELDVLNDWARNAAAHARQNTHK